MPEALSGASARDQGARRSPAAGRLRPRTESRIVLRGRERSWIIGILGQRFGAKAGTAKAAGGRLWRRLPIALRAVACLLLLGGSSAAEEWSGQPSLTRFAPADTDAQPYSFGVLALDSGEVFIGNADGLLRYYGKRWLRIEVPGAGTVRSLALGKDGRIYVGGYQNFGVLERAADGRYGFVSLERKFFPDAAEGAPLGEIWDTVAVDDGVWFATNLQLFGRPAPGVTPAAAAAFVAGFGERLVRAHPAEHAGSSWRAVSMQATAAGDSGGIILPLLIGLSGFVLLIACSNLAWSNVRPNPGVFGTDTHPS